jgi:hypothetical protein
VRISSFPFLSALELRHRHLPLNVNSEKSIKFYKMTLLLI